MKYKYRTFVSPNDPEGVYTYPLVGATLKHGRKQIRVDCLVDSGATESLFSYDIAALLGIDLTKAQEQEYIGIGTSTFKGRRKTVQLKLNGFDTWISIDAGFIDQNEMPLLGHSGFFENYEIVFRAYEEKFEIKKR